MFGPPGPLPETYPALSSTLPVGPARALAPSCGPRLGPFLRQASASLRDVASPVCHIYRYLGFSVIKWESLCNQDGMDTTNTSILVWIPLWTDMVLWLTTLDDLRIWGVVVEGV